MRCHLPWSAIPLQLRCGQLQVDDSKRPTGESAGRLLDVSEDAIGPVWNEPCRREQCTTAIGHRALTHAYGRELFARLDRRGRLCCSVRAWWDDRLMEWTMGDEAVKVQLFRFIDALPLLHAPADVSRHLREYFGEAGEHAAGLAAFRPALAAQRRLGRPVLAGTAHAQRRAPGPAFIAGSNVRRGARSHRPLRRRSMAFTVDLLGEATITEAEADRYQDEYLELIDGLSEQSTSGRPVDLIDRDPHGPLPRVNVSIKLSSLYSQFDPIDPDGTSAAVLRRVCGRSCGWPGATWAFVNIDMEQYAFKDLTLRIFQRGAGRGRIPRLAGRRHRHPGLSADTAEPICRSWRVGPSSAARRSGCGSSRGRYWDYETVDWRPSRTGRCRCSRNKRETDANYEAADAFPAGNHELLRPAFGSHNVRSLRPCPGRCRGDRTAAASYRDPDALRHGRSDQGRPGRAGPTRPRLYAVWPAAAGHGVSGAAAAGKHGQRIVLAGQLHRTRARGTAAHEPC